MVLNVGMAAEAALLRRQVLPARELTEDDLLRLGELPEPGPLKWRCPVFADTRSN